MVEPLSQLPIQLLHIVVIWECDNPYEIKLAQDELPGEQTQNPSTCLHLLSPADSLDLEPVAGRLMDSISSLRYLCLQAGPCIDIWEIREDEGGRDNTRQLVKLPLHEGLTIIYGSVLHRTY